MSEIESIKDYGAVGDGVTNDREAIQRAVDSVAPRYCPVVYPSGDGVDKCVLPAGHLGGHEGATERWERD